MQIESINELFVEARDEIDYAKEDAGAPADGRPALRHAAERRRLFASPTAVPHAAAHVALYPRVYCRDSVLQRIMR